MSYAVSPVHIIVRWTEFDISSVWANSQVSLVQQGDLNDGMNLDISYAKLDVDRDGNMMINFVMTGTEQFPSLGYTGRLRTDPLGTLRYPLHIWAPGNSTFVQFEQGRNRYGDYLGGVFDPVDRKTFWMFGQIPNPVGPFNVNGSATDWTTVIGTAHLERNGECPVQLKTTPKHNYINQRTEASYAASHPTTVAPNDGEEGENSRNEIDE